MPVHNWKYAPIVRRATELLRSGAIGRLHDVEIETLRIQDCAVADPDHPNWRRDPAIAGGGVLMDHGWHAIYLARHWFGEDPIDVRASLHRSMPKQVEDEAALTLAFPSGQAKIFLTGGRTRAVAADMMRCEPEFRLSTYARDRAPFVGSAASRATVHPHAGRGRAGVISQISEVGRSRWHICH